MINHGSFRGDLISASLVNLAVNGYLRIIEKDEPVLFGLFSATSFSLIKLKEADAALPAEEKILMDRLFSNGSQATIDGKYSSQMKNLFDGYMNSLVEQHRPFLTQGSNWKLWIPPVFIFILYAWVASKFDFADFTPANLDFNMGDFSSLPVAVIIGVFMIIVSTVIKKMGKWVFAGLILIVFTGGSAYLYQAQAISLNHAVLTGFIFFAVVSYGAYIYLIRKPSIEKLDLKARIAGFKKYLGAAEERQMQMFNPPSLTPEVFEKLLPFAMAFKVDKIWGQKFQNLMDRASVDQRHQSAWYTGSRAYRYHSLGNHIQKSLGSSINKSAGRGSGGSGSRGGGSSGGGRGGGGGGGW